MPDHPVVSPDAWLEARRELLVKEKAFSRQRDELTQARLALPWKRVEKPYTFEGSDGSASLADLFGEASQLIVYHFMFGPDWTEGCKMCSLLADHYDPLVIHLAHRDTSLVTVSRAPLPALDAYKQRMGWSFPWVSSLHTDFNHDFHVSFTQEALDAREIQYNFEDGADFSVIEAPGISAFFKDDDGEVFHTYSSYGRGLENFLGVYNFLDIVAKGRDEDDLPYGMAWVRHRDKYDDA